MPILDHRFLRVMDMGLEGHLEAIWDMVWRVIWRVNLRVILRQYEVNSGPYLRKPQENHRIAFIWP